MSLMRTYGDGCGIAHGLDVIGERWALLIVRELLLGPKRFTDLRAGLPGISSNVLSLRLYDTTRFRNGRALTDESDKAAVHMPDVLDSSHNFLPDIAALVITDPALS